MVNGGFYSKMCDGIDGIIRLLIKGIRRWIHAAVRQRLCFFPGVVLVGEKGFEICPSFVGHGLCILEATGIGKIPVGEYGVVVSGGYLLRGVRHFSGINKINGCLNMVDNGLERLIGSHVGIVIL